MDYQTLQWWGLREGGGDPITSKWPGVSSVVYPLSAIGVYLVLVYRNYHREFKTPANIRTYLKFYNIFQVLLSAYIFSETVITAWSAKYNIWCEPLRSTLSYNGRRMAIASYLFHVSKYIDLLDTFFMVVRGNKHQITVLHIFHHSSMILNSWMGIRHAPTGHSFFIHLANSFVHICMYSYYFLSSLGTWIRPYLWWKPLLTQMQIIQFFFMFIHMMFGFYNDCPLPMPLVKTVLIYLVVLIGLFINFYIQTYLKGSRKFLKNKEC
ncbi:UNVERIFIED_CONTAM: hypothetical protein RMT77_008247 [Armadillidium vulgare]